MTKTPLDHESVLLPGLPVERILACYSAAPGNEIESGKFSNPESSAALAANVFGYFLDRPADLPSFPGCDDLGWPAQELVLEAIVRFPWSGGRHPCLDALLYTKSALIGVESKRYEPFRAKPLSPFSSAYWRPVWGDSMVGYERIRDALRDGSCHFNHLDAAQLVKHAFALRTAVHAHEKTRLRRPVLFYVYAEPKAWPNGRPIDQHQIEAHRTEIARFTDAVQEDEVAFRSASYGDLLSTWRSSENERIRDHALAIMNRFSP